MMEQLRRPIVTLTTDFGMKDWYVGALRGAVLRRCPEAQLVDICHDIVPQDVASAADVLRLACLEFPPETVHVVVVDPGVGTERTPVLVRACGMWWVGPDNGVFSLVNAQCPAERVYAIENMTLCSPTVSHTFHGRDVFGPIAGYIANGGDPDRVGAKTALHGRIPEVKSPTVQSDRIVGTVVTIDHFGNLITNIEETDIGSRGRSVLLPSQEMCPLVSTYGDENPGDLVALVGSSGRLEVAVVNGDASARLQLSRGACITILLD